jgi:hypothetical protein
MSAGAIFAWSGVGWAQEFRFLEPASVLVMPFDVTANHASFQIVSRIGPTLAGAPVRTHWVYYAADCRHLVDVFISLTDDDTVVVDPRALRGEIQALNPPRNDPVGPVIDLSGERGIVTVTAFAPSGGASPQLVGGWTIADTTTLAAFGADAIGLPVDGALPDPALLTQGIFLPSLDPSALDDSQIIVIALEADGDGITPIARASDELDGAHVCCDVGFIDNLETGFSLPTFCFDCVGFAAIAGDLADEGEVPLIPPSTAATSPGVVHLRNCRSGTFDGAAEGLGQGDFEQFVFAFHGQAVGAFGAALSGKYSGTGINQ